MDRSRGYRVPGVHAPWGYGVRHYAVLLRAQRDLVPGRHHRGAARWHAAVRGGGGALASAGRAGPTEADRLRREPGRSRQRSRVRRSRGRAPTHGRSTLGRRAARQPGSPMIQPIVDDGRTVRFWNRHGPAGDPINGPWPHPRVIVLQHPSDPVVWWSTDLLLSEPEWMREPSGDDVLPTFAWHP